jgi:hypothetical protein
MMRSVDVALLVHMYHEISQRHLSTARRQAFCGANSPRWGTARSASIDFRAALPILRSLRHQSRDATGRDSRVHGAFRAKPPAISALLGLGATERAE